MYIYISFGSSHNHTVCGKVFNQNTVCRIKCNSHSEGRELAVNVFGLKFCTSYESPQAEEYAKKYGWEIVDLPTEDIKSWGEALIKAATGGANLDNHHRLMPVGSIIFAESGEPNFYRIEVNESDHSYWLAVIQLTGELLHETQLEIMRRFVASIQHSGEEV
jgi:hypothetical protein